MKKLFTITFALLLALGLSAQTEQGSMLIGANTDLSFTSISDLGYTVDGEDPYDGYEPSETTYSSIGADLKFGYFIIDNLAMGALLNYTSTRIDYGDSDIDNPDPLNETSYGAFARYYIAGVAFIGGSYVMTTSSLWSDLDDKPTRSIMGAEVGFALFLSDNVAFTPTVAYGIQTDKLKYEWSGEDVVEKSMTGMLKISAGITIHL